MSNNAITVNTCLLVLHRTGVLNQSIENDILQVNEIKMYKTVVFNQGVEGKITSF